MNNLPILLTLSWANWTHLHPVDPILTPLNILPTQMILPLTIWTQLISNRLCHEPAEKNYLQNNPIPSQLNPLHTTLHPEPGSRFFLKIDKICVIRLKIHTMHGNISYCCTAATHKPDALHLSHTLNYNSFININKFSNSLPNMFYDMSTAPFRGSSPENAI
jgi:hypothetical protein